MNALDQTSPTGTERFLRLRAATDHVNLIEIQDGVLADYLPEMVWIVRASDRCLLYANPSYYAYFGVKLPTWEGRSRYFHQDDLPLVDEAFNAVRQTGSSPKKEIRLLGSDGQYRWHLMRLTPIISDGQIAEFLITAMDIDDIVKSRQSILEATDLLTLSQEAAGAGSWDLNLRDESLKLSRESARLHGLGDQAVEMDLEGWKRVVNPEDAKTVLDALQNAVKTKTTFYGTFRVCAAHTGLRWLSGIGRAYYDENDDPIRMIGLNFDITERKTAEEKILKANADAEHAKAMAEEARQQAEQASLAKSNFLASMSHEIRTPLHSIIGYTDLTLENVEHDSPLRRNLEVIQEASAALLIVVNDILDFSKIEAGQIELEPIQFSITALVDNVFSMLFGIAQCKGIVLSRHVAPQVATYAIGDEARLRQILLNLVNNAVKFTNVGHVDIYVTTEEGAETGVQTIRFCVEDSGIGIAAKNKERLFQRFSQVDCSISRTFGGTGLGLAISKQLVEKMGGEIGVDSVEGKGSTFWFAVALPVAETASSGFFETKANTHDLPITAHILLVEDVAVNQDLARVILEAQGHRVDVAGNGTEAIAKVLAKPYDLVLMDIHMPVMDGVTATRRIRRLEAETRSVPIVAMTANVLPHQIAAFKDAGMDDHVGKPFKRSELFAAIEHWAGRTSDKYLIEVPKRDVDVAPESSDVAAHDHAIFEGLREMLGDDVCDTLIKTFDRDVCKLFEPNLAGLDRARLERDAHAMISSAGSFGFTGLSALCRQIEAACHDGRDLAPFYPTLEQAGRQVHAKIASLRRPSH